MPIYEYVCTACEREFEEFARSMTVKKTPPCPHCRSSRVVQKLSVFAAREGTARSTGSFAGGGCGRCGDPNGPCAL